MSPLKKWLLAKFGGPAKTVPVRRPGSNPAAIAQTMDAASIADVLRSAEAGSMQDYFALCRDIVAGHAHTQGEFGKRKRAVLNDVQTISARDKGDAAQVAIASAIADQIDRLPAWQDSLSHLLNATIYPLAVVEKIYRPSSRPGWRWELADLIPVPYQYLDFSKRGIHVFATNEAGELTGGSFSLDPSRYIVHRGHLFTDIPDVWGGPFRAIIFWWLFATMGRDWWARFLDRFGAPFLEGKYDPNDDDSRVMLEAAFASASRLLGIAVPNEASVAIHQVQTQGAGDAFDAFHSVANREISKLIVGQSGSADVQAQGLGSGQSDLQGSLLDDLRKFDSTQLAATIRSQLFIPLAQLNGFTTPAPAIWWGGESADDQAVSADILRSLKVAGLRITDAGIEILSRRLALPLQRDSAGPVGGPMSDNLMPLAGGVPANLPALDPFLAVQSIARRGAGDFAGGMASAHSELARIVAASSSLEDLETRLLAAIPGMDVGRASDLALAAIGAAGLNAVAAFPEARPDPRLTAN
jgi:phage gp29-like protein